MPFGVFVFVPISENLSAGWRKISLAIENKDAATIESAARAAVSGGALALNVGGACNLPNELENLKWLLEFAAVDGVSICVDSATPEVQKSAAARFRELRNCEAPENCLDERGVPWMIINSITGENERYSGTIEVVKENNAAVVALAMDERGVPEDANGRYSAAAALIDRLDGDGVTSDRIFIDPLVLPAGVNEKAGRDVIETVSRLKKNFPDVRVTCGLSNVSHGLPLKKRLNRIFLAMLVGVGLDSAIMDTTDPEMMKALRAALALHGRDSNFAEYIGGYRRES